MGQHRGALTADLRAEYGVSLEHVYLPTDDPRKLTPNHVAVLADHLPVGSNVWSVESDEVRGWSLEAHMLADVFHALTGEEHPARAHLRDRTPARQEARREKRLRYEQRLAEDAARRGKP